MPMCNFCFIHLVCYQIIDVEYTYAFGISYAVLLYICNVMYVVSVLPQTPQSCTQHSSEDLETYRRREESCNDSKVTLTSITCTRLQNL